MTRSTEHDIAYAAMKYLATIPSGAADTSEVKAHVADFIQLTPDDLAASETRPNEALWQQVVGNIVSHRKDSPDNFINRGLIAYDGGIWSLTDVGRRFLDRRGV